MSNYLSGLQCVASVIHMEGVTSRGCAKFGAVPVVKVFRMLLTPSLSISMEIADRIFMEFKSEKGMLLLSNF